jgi:hypothetical protein
VGFAPTGKRRLVTAHTQGGLLAMARNPGFGKITCRREETTCYDAVQRDRL